MMLLDYAPRPHGKRARPRGGGSGPGPGRRTVGQQEIANQRLGARPRPPVADGPAAAQTQTQRVFLVGSIRLN